MLTVIPKCITTIKYIVLQWLYKLHVFKNGHIISKAFENNFFKVKLMAFAIITVNVFFFECAEFPWQHSGHIVDRKK